MPKNTDTTFNFNLCKFKTEDFFLLKKQTTVFIITTTRVEVKFTINFETFFFIFNSTNFQTRQKLIKLKIKINKINRFIF